MWAGWRAGDFAGGALLAVDGAGREGFEGGLLLRMACANVAAFATGAPSPCDWGGRFCLHLSAARIEMRSSSLRRLRRWRAFSPSSRFCDVAAPSDG